MRVTIWQQFGSNHSADFTVVGKFESTERANEVAEELRSMIRAIGQWWEQYPEFETKWQVERDLLAKGQLTPPETLYKNQYHVPWPGEHDAPLDWIRGQAATNAVGEIGDWVLIDTNCIEGTWMGSQPFEGILQKLGGKVVAQVEDRSELYMHFRFDAPDEATAEAIFQSVRQNPPQLLIPDLFPPRDDKVGKPHPFIGQMLREKQRLKIDVLLPSILLCTVPSTLNGLPAERVSGDYSRFEQIQAFFAYGKRHNGTHIEVDFEARSL